MGWNDVAGKSDKDGIHLSIKPNQTIKVHILLEQGEEPVSYWSHFIRSPQGKNRSVICPGRDVCPACANGNIKTKRQHAMNVWDYESNSVKILEQGNSIMQQIKMVYDQYGSLDIVDISIKRIGEGLSTQYLVMPLPLTAPFSEDVSGKFDIKKIKTADSIEKIRGLLDGVLDPTPGSAVKPTPQPVSQPMASASKGAPGTVQFGKYKGQTLEDIAKKDLNYVKWCAENIQEESIRAEANRIVNGLGNTTVVPKNTPVDSKQKLIDEAYNIINTDVRYKGNIATVVAKMKEATATAEKPGGKMLLQDYTEDELTKFIENLKGKNIL